MQSGGNQAVASDLAVGAAVRRYALPATTVLFVALAVWLTLLDLPLRNEVAPTGVVAFELARTAERSAAILDSWDQRAKEGALLLHGLDYLFLLVYSAWLFLLSRKVAAALGGRWQPVGNAVAVGALFCAPFDAIENYALIVQLRDGATEALAYRAWLAATPKFVFFTAAVAFVLTGAGALLARRLGSRAN